MDAGSNILYQSNCLKEQNTEIKIQCSSNERIKILKTVLGYNRDYSSRLLKSSINIENLCSFSVNDCIYTNDTNIEIECNGRNSCITKLNKSAILNESSASHQCKDYNYVQINYYCLPGNRTSCKKH